MQSHNDRRIRQVWESTQDNLETAVGTAYTGWTAVQARYVEPAVGSAAGWLDSCLGVCWSSRRPPANIRRSSADFFFDMYDEDDGLDRDELERLLSSEDDGALGAEASSARAYEQGASFKLHPGISASSFDENMSPSASSSWPVTLLRDTGRSLSSVVFSALPQWATPPSLKYKPSTAGLTGVRRPQRSRSSTKSSIQSTETFRSRRDLLSDAEIEDAQMVSDNFAASIVYGPSDLENIQAQASTTSEGALTQGSVPQSNIPESEASAQSDIESAPSVPSRQASALSLPLSLSPDSHPSSSTVPEMQATIDEKLRQEELEAERQEEAEIARKRNAANLKAQSLGLGASKPGPNDRTSSIPEPAPSKPESDIED